MQFVEIKKILNGNNMNSLMFFIVMFGFVIFVYTGSRFANYCYKQGYKGEEPLHVIFGIISIIIYATIIVFLSKDLKII